jgi:hypothetical protein
VDGYAQLVAARVSLGKPELAIEAGQSIFDQATKLIERHGHVQVPYYNLANRPFHRLAHGLVLAHLGVARKASGVEKDAAKARARAIIDQMLVWWPNDNMGLRFLKSSCRKSRQPAAVV